MLFFDTQLNADIEAVKTDEGYLVTVRGQTISLHLPDEWVCGLPEWVVQESIKLLVRKRLRKQELDRLAASIIKKEL